MFLEYYGLREQPFAQVSGTQLYLSRTHCETLDGCRRSVLHERGMLALVGGPGVGKTTLLLELVEDLRRSGCVAAVFGKGCGPAAILQSVLTHLDVLCTHLDPAAMQSKLNQIWFAEMLSGKRVVLLFDDAEELDDELIGTLQLLSRFETSRSKFVQIVLCGQPKLLKQLEQKNLEPLRKRLAEVKRLETLSPMETAGYIRHHLAVAQCSGTPLFEPEAMALVAQLSDGVLKNINRICLRALLEAYARGKHVVSGEIVGKAERSLAAPPTASAGTAMKLRPSGKVWRPIQFPNAIVWAVAIALGVLGAGRLALPHSALKSVGKVVAVHDNVPAESALRERASTQAPVAVTTPQTTVAFAQTPAVEQLKPATRPFVEDQTKRTEQISLSRELGLKIHRIVIDPGHGGSDTGAKGPHGLLEKDLCLDVALRLGQLIQERVPGAQIVYTRKSDVYVPLEQRTAIANGTGADLFISIHANSSSISEVRGVETYYLSLAGSKEAKEIAARENALSQSSMHELPELVQKITNNEKIAESRVLAAAIQDMLSQNLQFVSQGERDRGVRRAPFIVLTGANMPAVLSEISFISNVHDENLLLGTDQRQRIAAGLYRGIASYLDGLEEASQNREKLVTQNQPSGTPVFQRTSGELHAR